MSMSTAEAVSRPPLASALQVEESHTENLYPAGFKFVSTTLGVFLLFVLVGLDGTIIATAIPTMTRYFGTIADIGWYTSVYRLTAGSFQFLFGKAYSVFPIKPMIMTSLALFATGNLLCACASTSLMLIVGRALTGFATAGMVSGAFAVIVQTTPLRKRSIYAGMGGAIEAVAILTAPLVGGFLTDKLSWRWCFFIELPLTVLAFILVTAFLAIPKRNGCESSSFREKIDNLDLPGTALFVPSLTSLMLALQWGGTRYGWTNWRILVGLGSFSILIVAFIWLQYLRQERATIPPRIILQRSVTFGFLFSFCNNAALSIVEYYMPIYFQTVKGNSASLSGVMILPIAGGLIFSVSLSGFLTSTWGYYSPFMIMTGILTPPSIGLVSTLNNDAGTWRVIFYQAMLGFGAGIGFQGPQVAVQTIFDAKDIPIGIGIIQFAQGIGPAIFTVVAQNIFTRRLAANIKEYAPEVDFTELKGYGLTIPKNRFTVAEYDGIMRSYDEALTQTFYLSVSLACMTILGAVMVEWRSVKAKRP